MTLERGIRTKPGRPGIEARVQVNGRCVTKYFLPGTPIEEIRAWRKSTVARKPGSTTLTLPSVRIPPRATEGGFVYFAQVREFIKIGKAKDIRQRLEELQTAHPDELRLVAWIHTLQPSRIEATIKNEYRSSCVRGEWFRLSRDIMRLIQAKAGARNQGMPLNT